MAKSPDDLIKKGVQVSTPLAIFNQLNEAINNPETSFSDIAGIINKDSSLSLRLLKIANSSFYSFPSKIETITQAITIIGTNQLRDLVLATTVINSFKGISESLINMDLFWRHSIACGLAARIIATYRRELNVERFYVRGILHDIGRLVLYMEAPVDAGKALKIAKSKNKHLHAAEREVMGFDHAAVGGALMKAWELPDSLREAITFHHGPEKAVHFPVDSAIVHLADIIANALQLGSSGEGHVPHLDTAAWDVIGLPVNIISPTVEQIERQFDDAIQMFLPKKK